MRHLTQVYMCGGLLIATLREQMLKNLGDMAVGTLVWWVCGWGIAYGADDGLGAFGTSEFFSINIKEFARSGRAVLDVC